MKNKLMIALIVLLLLLPCVAAQVTVQLGQPYVNIDDFSGIEFITHPDYYEICSLDDTVIPVLIKNKNNFSDTFKFEVDKEYASLAVRNAVLRSGKSAILPLTISPPIGVEENTTLILDIMTTKEGLRRSLIIKTNIRKCYLFELEIDKDKDEICGCDEGEYSLILNNEGRYTDTFTLNLDIPEWVNSTLTNKTVELRDGQKKEIRLEANPSCEEKGVFTVSAEAISEKTEVALKDELELTVFPQDECYNTIISADNAEIDYFGKNIPITIKNEGVKDATYLLEVEGIDWYTLSQTEFSLKPDSEKTINLALYPDENVVEGEYNIDIIAKTDSQEFTGSITVNLESKDVVFGKARFYLNYFRYYIGAGVVLLVIILLLIVIIRIGIKKVLKKRKIKDTGKLEEEVIKKEEKKAVKKVKKISKGVRWFLSFILYLIFLGLLALLTYSTFKYRSYYEKVLNFILGLFTNYIVPYEAYLRYLITGLCILAIVLLIIDFYRKKPKKRKVEKVKETSKEAEEEVKKPAKKEIKKVSLKKVEKRKLRFFEYVYLVLVIFLFLAIVAYTIYKLSGKSVPVDRFTTVKDFAKSYLWYFVIGIIILVLLVAIIRFMKKTRKAKEKKEVVKKLKKKTRKLIRNIAIMVVGLVILSAVVYLFVHYNLIAYIRYFFVLYYPYLLMGAGILIILILILHFQNKKIS